MNNLLTDIAGVRVGHAGDAGLASGVTAVIFDRPVVAAMDVRGGGPGTREGALLDLANTVDRIDAIERQLAHVDGDSVRRAYARAEFWDERVKMMQWWGDYLHELHKLGQVAALRA